MKIKTSALNTKLGFGFGAFVFVTRCRRKPIKTFLIFQSYDRILVSVSVLFVLTCEEEPALLSEIWQDQIPAQWCWTGKVLAKLIAYVSGNLLFSFSCLVKSLCKPEASVFAAEQGLINVLKQKIQLHQIPAEQTGLNTD